MVNPVARLLQILGASTNAELRRQIQFLKAQNVILQQRLPGHVRPRRPSRVTSRDR